MQEITPSLEKLNNKALEIVTQYQNIPFEGKTISTPYFINSVEQIYKNIFIQVGVDANLVDSAIKLIREDKTPLGSRAGKASPQEIESSLLKLQNYLLTKNIDLSTKSTSIVREFMKEFHIGVDCSGLVYNTFLLATSETEQTIFKDSLLWHNTGNRIAMQASCSIFNSPKLTDVADLKGLLPMDVLIFQNNSHMGMVLMKDRDYFLVDSSMEKNSVTLNPFNKETYTVEGRQEWQSSLENGKVVIKRFNF